MAAPLAALVAAAVLLVAPALASADTSSSLTVVGTSDVSDSGLVPNVIMPDFNRAYPQFTFKYIGSATGTAINNAKSGNGGPSALIVHAASLENQFVAGGYSYNNQYGNAIFTNDFVLAGSKGDPAGVGANAAHNIAQSFADVANAGAVGRATFLTRGGTTTASGTTVEEHGIWALVFRSGLKPASLVLCNVSAADGGGMSPIKSTVQATSGQACPDSGTVNGTAAPSWYYVNSGSNQGANVIATNACTVGTSGANTCYVLTDRGTFAYLSSGTSPSAGTVGIANLGVVSSDNSASAPGGQYELVNYFHVYIINPSKPGETVNLAAAQDFVNLLTSTTFQSQLKGYLPASAGGPPFTASASPLISTTKRLPTTYRAGRKWTVAGTVTNAQPGFPAPSGKPISVDQIVGGVSVPVASGKTNATGGFSISYVPPASGSYELVTPQISQIEIPTLTPPYGDILSPAATAPVKVAVHSAITQLTGRSQGAAALILGAVSPGTGHVKATVTILALKVGSRKGFRKVTTDRLVGSDANFATVISLAAGKWLVQARYQDPTQVVAAPSRTIRLTVGAKPRTSVSFSSVKVFTGSVTMSGSIKPAAPRSGATIEVLAMKTSGGPPKFGEKTTVKVRGGNTKFTARFKLARGYRWVLRLVNRQNGQSPSDTGLRTINVK